MNASIVIRHATFVRTPRRMLARVVARARTCASSSARASSSSPSSRVVSRRDVVMTRADAPASSRVRAVDDAAPTSSVTTKHRRRSRPATIEPDRSSARAPDGWEKTLETIKRWRAEGPPAAVDTMGCEKIASLDGDPVGDDGKYRRYLTLTSAMLSSQTRDEINHAAMMRLRARGCTPESVAATEEDALDALLNPVGFHRRKAGYLRETAKILLEEYDGDIPRSVEGLCALPGVGPKMAYLVMNVGWKTPTGICVDVHVHRISERLGWVPESVLGKNGSPKKKTPEDTRAALESWLPREEWIEINPLLVGFGQLTCTPLRPKCAECPLAADGSCPSAFKESTGNPKSPKPTKKRVKVEVEE